MKAYIKKIAGLFKSAFMKWKSNDPINQSSIIAYCSIFSLPGLLVVVINLAGYFFEKEAVGSHLHEQIASSMGTDTANQIQGMVTTASDNKNSIIATIIGIFTIVLGATGVFVQLQKSLNNVWKVKAKPAKSGIWAFLRARLFSFGLIISIAFLLLISLVISSVIVALGNWAKDYWPEFLLFLFQILNFIFSMAIVTVLFAMMFKILPDAQIKWRYVWMGSFVTALLFVIAKSALGLYFGTANPGSGYGAGGSVILILLWTSYSSMIVFYGAEFTKAYADLYHGYVVPTEIAVQKREPKKG